MLEVHDACAAYGLRRATLSIAPGESVALIGLNGSGKSTLARLLCAMDLPMSGSVVVDGVDTASGDAARQQVRRLVGLVQQDPTDQLVTTVVYDEVAFGPRNLGVAEDQVALRVHAALEAVELAGREQTDVSALSGGEQQRLALAGVLAMRPRYLVLDEATSQLDSGHRARFNALANRLVRDEGLGLVRVTHDIHEVLASTRVVLVEDGRIAWEGTPDSLLRERPDAVDELFLSTPYLEALRAAVRDGMSYAGKHSQEWLFERFGAKWASCECPLSNSTVLHGADNAPESVLSFDNVSYAYDLTREEAVAGLSFAVRPGRVTLIAGRSGSGKSTLACLAAGLFAPDEGIVRLHGAPPAPAACGLAFQRPEDQLFLDTVYDELAFAPRNAGLDEAGVKSSVTCAARLLGIDEKLLGASPFELSGGQARRVGLACVLSLPADAFVLDEPTAGLDAPARRLLHRAVLDLAAEGKAVVVISHDLEEWTSVATDALILRQGRIAWSGAAEELATSLTPYKAGGLEPTASARLRCAKGRESHA